MRAARFQRPPQRCTGAEKMRLAHVLIEGLWAQPIRERLIRAGGHGYLLRPITSTPGGGANENRSGARVRLRLELENVS